MARSAAPVSPGSQQFPHRTLMLSDPRETLPRMKKEGEEDQRSVDARLAELARDQYGLISRTQALEMGMCSGSIHNRLTAELWLRTRPGVYRFAAVRTSWHQSLMAACLQIPGAVAYGRTAGWLHGLDGLGRVPPTPLELAVERTRNPRCDDVRVVRVRHLKGEWTHRDGIPVTHLPRTLIDLAGLLKFKDAEMALDSAMRGKPGLKSWLRRVLAKYPPHSTGAPHVMRKLLEVRTSPTDSGLELEFEQLLRDSGLPEPTYRTPIYDDDGRIGSIDYIWNEHRLVLQTHGWQWHGCRLRWRTDLVQRRRLSVDNWKIIEVTREDLELPNGPETVLALLRRGLANQAAFLSYLTTKTEPGWA